MDEKVKIVAGKLEISRLRDSGDNKNERKSKNCCREA